MADNAYIAAKTHYVEQLRRLERDGVPEWVREIRRKGTDSFVRTPFPDSSMEAWRFTDVLPILDRPFRFETQRKTIDASAIEAYLYNRDGWTEFVFVDGVYSRRLSRVNGLAQGILAADFATAFATAPDVMRRHLASKDEARDAFYALNDARLEQGMLVHASKDARAESDIHILYLSTGREALSAASPRTLIVAEAGSRLSVVEDYVALDEAEEHFTNAVTDIHLAENAEVHYGKNVAQPGGYHLGAVLVAQERSSRFSSACVTTTGNITRNAMQVEFQGADAECRLEGLYVNRGAQMVDHTLSVRHAHPNCRSRIAYKGIVGGDGRAVYRGGVRVEKEAQKTDSSQVNRNLLLSDQARVDTTPKLEIFADDVKCTHGATVGSPPDDLLFYFRSRGIGETEAKRMLTFGFAGEIIDRIEHEPWRERLRAQLEKEL